MRKLIGFSQTINILFFLDCEMVLPSGAKVSKNPAAGGKTATHPSTIRKVPAERSTGERSKILIKSYGFLTGPRHLLLAHSRRLPCFAALCRKEPVHV